MVIKCKKYKQQTMNTNTIKNMDYNWSPGPEPPNSQEAGVARAVFIPHANSLPFEERRVTLEQPVKIGRNVYRATPTPTNTIFECRVLSRHHATLYYDKGHFYLVDHQSSNGTFINNNRCSISKDQEPHEVFSGDIVQFGISVVENAAEKNTFPPVVALLKLFHPDGKEAKLSFNPTMTTPLHLKELYQLNNFVQEAIQREASLETRVRSLRECVERTRAEAAAAWQLFVGEQRLLMRVHTLESMLAAGKQPEAQLVGQLLDDKRNYQEVAQESLRAAHEQRLSLEESLERRSREAAALHQHNCSLRAAANSALAELQKLAARCERKMCAARIAIAAAEEREAKVRDQLPLAYSVQNGEAKMLVLSTDNNRSSSPRRSSLEDAVRTLPDYIKLLLPQNVLNKVGIKAVAADGKSAKEFELILKKNNIYDAECREKEKEEESGVEGGSVEEITTDICTDDEKQSRLNHDTTEVESAGELDGELHDNNANSTYSEHSREDSPSKAGVEYANILRVMAGLNEEIRALRERVASAAQENDALRGVRDELLAAREETTPEHDAATYRQRITDLQAQLTRTTVAEEANLAEIQRLTATAAELQAELAFRPTRRDLDELTAGMANLTTELCERDQRLLALQATRASLVDKATETDHVVPADDLDATKISADIDEMFRLDDDDEDVDETSSSATELTSRPGGDDVGEPADKLPNGALLALEEELVRAKEKWAEERAERARLSAQLATLQGGRRAPLLALAVPLAAAALYWALLPYIS